MRPIETPSHAIQEYSATTIFHVLFGTKKRYEVFVFFLFVLKWMAWVLFLFLLWLGESIPRFPPNIATVLTLLTVMGRGQ